MWALCEFAQGGVGGQESNSLVSISTSVGSVKLEKHDSFRRLKRFFSGSRVVFRQWTEPLSDIN